MNPTEETKRLFDLYGEEIYQYALYNLNDSQEASDVVQEIFLQVHRSWHRFEGRSSVKTWLWTITNHCIYNVYRHRKRHNELSIDYVKDTAVPHEFDVTLLDFESAIRRLPLAQQQVFIQRVMHDMTTKETAQSLGWSESKVKTTLHRATQKLKFWMSEEETKDEL